MTLRLVKTCLACPEQYNVYQGEELIGYLRLRHGYFRAETRPEVAIVYEANPKGDGIFTEDERDFHLTMACHALIQNHMPLYTIEESPPEPEELT